MTPPPNPLSPELAALLAKGDVIAFVGAGISIGAGLPGWLKLVRPLAQQVSYRMPASDADVTADHLLTAAQYYENQRSPAALIAYLRDTLDILSVKPSAVHVLLASLPIKTIFTTNYDDLIERALRDAGKRSNVIVGESDLALWSEDQTQIIKLCGDLRRPESIVITKRDFNTFFSVRPRLGERLRSSLETKTPLFLGYSLQDPFFNQIWDQIGLSFGNMRRYGYVALFDPEPNEVDDLKQRGIQVIALSAQGRDRTTALFDFLKTLAPQIDTALPSTNNAPTKPLPVVNPPPTPAKGSVDKIVLRQAMIKSFKPKELDLLCNDMMALLQQRGVQDSIDMSLVGEGGGLASQVLDLIQYCDRRGWFNDLVEAVRAARPGIIP